MYSSSNHPTSRVSLGPGDSCSCRGYPGTQKPQKSKNHWSTVSSRGQRGHLARPRGTQQGPDCLGLIPVSLLSSWETLGSYLNSLSHSYFSFNLANKSGYFIELLGGFINLIIKCVMICLYFYVFSLFSRSLCLRQKSIHSFIYLTMTSGYWLGPVLDARQGPEPLQYPRGPLGPVSTTSRFQSIPPDLGQHLWIHLTLFPISHVLTF